MKKFLFFIFSFSFVFAKAQITILDLLQIPDSVKKNASVIKQYENIMFEVTDIDRATLDVHQVFTIMAEAGKSRLSFYEHTSKFESLDEAEIRVYDLSGKSIGKYKKKDMITVATGEGLIDDGFVTYFSVPATSYPVTVEYIYKKKFKGTLFYPRYQIQPAGTAVVSSSFAAKVPKDLDLRFKEVNIRLKPETKDDGKYKTYQWKVRNMPAFEYEEGSSDYRYPMVILAPNKFVHYGYEGELTSWKNYGLWQYSLYNGQDVLPADRKLFFQDLVKDAKDEREKVRLVYEYLQKNFRYVSIQLGIGGFRPFPADFTDKKKYGDCKGLTTYTKAALNAIGVKSYAALINSAYNSEPADPGFPSQIFNHVILCVPQKPDTIWLECTSSSIDFAAIGSSNENRNALLVTEAGGILVATPKSKSTDNALYSRSTVQLLEDGSGVTYTAFNTHGVYKELFQDLLKEKEDDQKEFLVHSFGFKQPDLFSLKENEGLNQHRVDLEMKMVQEVHIQHLAPMEFIRNCFRIY